MEETCWTYFIWQFQSWLFTASLSLNIAITAVYWVFLAEGNMPYINYVYHIAPLLFTGLDFVCNLCVVELNLVIWNFLLVSIYLLLNYFYTIYILHTPVYSIITWKTWDVSLRDYAMYSGLGVFLHVLIWLFTWLKLWLIYGESRRDATEPDTYVCKDQDTDIVVFII